MLTAASTLMMGTLLSPSLSPAIDLSGNANTYLQSRTAADGSKLLGAYEYINMAVQDIGKDGISFYTGGWLRYDLKTEEFGKKSNSDLQYAYLNFYSKKANTNVSIGRIQVFEGVAAERIDGIHARTDLIANFGISAFAGSSVETGIDSPGNNTIVGGRLSHQIPGLYRIGVSALAGEKNNVTVRKEEGLDVWIKPAGKVEFMGNSKYSGMESEWTKFDLYPIDWANHNYYLVLGPFSNVRLNTEASAYNYQYFFNGTTTRAFMFSPSVIDLKEKVTILGEEISYEVSKELSISVNYKGYDYRFAGNAAYTGVNLRYADSKVGGAGISIHRMNGDEDRLRYNETRVYGYRKIDHTDYSIDALNVLYDKSINGVSSAVSLVLAAQMELSTKVKLGADVEYASNPDYNRDIRTFFKVIYSFDTTRLAQAMPAERPAPVVPAPAPVVETPKPAEAAPVTPPPSAEPGPGAEQIKSKEGSR